MLAEISPVSTRFGAWLAGLLGMESNLIFQIAGMVVAATAVVGLIAMVALIGIYLERKIAGRMQNRRGPNRAGPYGLFQTLADGIKLLTKEDIIKDDVDEPLFRFAPYIVFIAAFAGFAVLPFAPGLVPASLDVGIFYFLAMIGLETIGIVMAGWSSNNKWSLIGSMREVAQVVSYEIPLGISAMTVVVFAGTMSLTGITDAQAGLMHKWMVFGNGTVIGLLVMIPAFLIFYISGLAACKRAPFDLPEAESELVAGFHTEYSGMRFGMFFLPEYAVMFSVSAATAALFLGGYHDPMGLSAPGAVFDGAWLWGLAWFMGKSGFLFLVMIALRWTLPRLRIDQVMYLCYKVLLPISMACLVGVAALRLIA